MPTFPPIPCLYPTDLISYDLVPEPVLGLGFRFSMSQTATSRSLQLKAYKALNPNDGDECFVFVGGVVRLLSDLEA